MVLFSGCKDSPISPETSDQELQQIIDEGLMCLLNSKLEVGWIIPNQSVSS
jgi:hypothetical protein